MKELKKNGHAIDPEKWNPYGGATPSGIPTE